MREILERIEELLSLQEKLVNLLLLSGSQKVKVSVNTAFDVLYHNIELLDLIEELIGSQEEFLEEYSREYTFNLVLEALSWMGLILPAIEEACPIFLRGIAEEERDPLYRIKLILKMVEESYNKGEHRNLIKVAKELHSLSSLLKYQIILARRAYMNLA
ncbi:MAG: hypothetical protein AB1353_08885 [Aquificota bacterium]|jgi:hypothetical protein|nr:MAG: hypothetical protein KNN14_03280 [Aquificota bacterium]HAV40287.1 hypothetical protein [Aquificaceae bacterium]HCO38407.1 hypothetical protein [Aquificaceae bacterium]